MDLPFSTLLKTSLQHLRTAVAADCQQRYKEAVHAYMEGGPLLLQLAREQELSTPTKHLLKTKCQLYLNRLQLIKTRLEAGEEVPPNTAVDSSQPNVDEVEVDSREFVQTLSYLPCNCTLEDVKGAEQVKEFLMKNLVLPLMFPGLPDSVTRIRRGILLYGLPGTGKTMLLSAVAVAVSCPVFRFTASDLVSRWVGSERCLERVKAVFMCARQNQPCIVIVDDLEMLCAPDLDTDIVSKVREEFSAQLKDVSAENQVTVLAATQKPWILSGTLRRRFDRRFYLCPPSQEERAQILSDHFADIKHQLSDTDLDHVGQMTSGYTGSDLAVVARSCSMVGVRALQEATHFRKVTVSADDSEDQSPQEMMMPCEPQDSRAVEITFDFLNPERIMVPPVTLATVEEELRQSRSSVCDTDLQQLKQWHEKFGQED